LGVPELDLLVSGGFKPRRQALRHNQRRLISIVERPVYPALFVSGVPRPATALSNSLFWLFS
jgi:hypothetical protein